MILFCHHPSHQSTEYNTNTYSETRDTKYGKFKIVGAIIGGAAFASCVVYYKFRPTEDHDKNRKFHKISSSPEKTIVAIEADQELMKKKNQQGVIKDYYKTRIEAYIEFCKEKLQNEKISEVEKNLFNKMINNFNTSKDMISSLSMDQFNKNTLDKIHIMLWRNNSFWYREFSDSDKEIITKIIKEINSLLYDGSSKYYKKIEKFYTGSNNDIMIEFKNRKMDEPQKYYSLREKQNFIKKTYFDIMDLEQNTIDNFINNDKMSEDDKDFFEKLKVYLKSKYDQTEDLLKNGFSFKKFKNDILPVKFTNTKYHNYSNITAKELALINATGTERVVKTYNNIEQSFKETEEFDRIIVEWSKMSILCNNFIEDLANDNLDGLPNEKIEKQAEWRNTTINIYEKLMVIFAKFLQDKISPENQKTIEKYVKILKDKKNTIVSLEPGKFSKTIIDGLLHNAESDEIENNAMKILFTNKTLETEVKKLYELQGTSYETIFNEVKDGKLND